ncbi:MAG: heavy metal translocating P-type ATPase, partial [Ruminococcaceae bacterium]|nr:heavy metal translocating P-type ATPase [Oscillospiraceae bacterium]
MKKMRRSFDIRGLDCANCAAKIEKAAKNIPGADHVSLDFVRRRLTLEADEAVFDRVLSDIMEKAADIEPTMRINRGGPDKDQISSVIKITASAFLFLTALLVPFSDKIKLILFIGAYAVSAYDILYKALRNIFKGHVFDENFLMSIATIGAIAISEYAEAVAVMLFYQTGELFQSIAAGKSRRSVSDLMDIRPDKAVVLRNGEEISVSPEKVEKGEILVVRPGEKIALDGIVVEGATSINSSAITGESIPQEKYEGDRVLSGTLNISGLIKIRTESVYSESTAAKIHKLMENAYEKKAKTERFISRFAGYYTPAVVISAAILALLPPAILGGGFREWLGRALVFLVVSCPCALVVSIPLSFCGGIGAAAKKGILVKGANFIEALASADTVAFDKTGTVTKGSFKTENIYSLGISEEELVELAAHIEAFSKHPVAKALTDAYGRETDREKISSVKEIPGKGIETCIDGKRYFAGNEKLMKQASLKYEPYLGNGTAVHIGSEERYLGYIALNDEIK